MTVGNRACVYRRRCIEGKMLVRICLCAKCILCRVIMNTVQLCACYGSADDVSNRRTSRYRRPAGGSCQRLRSTLVSVKLVSKRSESLGGCGPPQPIQGLGVCQAPVLVLVVRFEPVSDRSKAASREGGGKRNRTAPWCGLSSCYVTDRQTAIVVSNVTSEALARFRGAAVRCR